MKLYLKRTAISFVFVSLIFMLISFAIRYRLGITLGYSFVTFISFIIALIVGLSITLFKRQKGNDLINTILGFLTLLPVIFLIRRIFGIIIFRYSFVIYILLLIISITYLTAVMVIARRSKKEAKELNDILNKKE